MLALPSALAIAVNRRYPPKARRRLTQMPLQRDPIQAFDTNGSTTARVAVLVSSTAAGVSLGNLFQLRAKHIHSPVAVEITGQRDVKPVALFAFNDES